MTEENNRAEEKSHNNNSNIDKISSADGKENLNKDFPGSQTATGNTTGGGEDGNWTLAPGAGEQNTNKENSTGSNRTGSGTLPSK